MAEFEYIRMKYLQLIILLLQTAIGARIGEFDYSQGELNRMTNALESYKSLALQSLESHSKELIPELGNGLFKTGQTGNYVVNGRLEVHELLKEALLLTPGHAEYYRDKINAARMKMEEARGNLSNYAYYESGLRDVIRYDFPKLEQMPSPETVRVLGELLFDERGYVRVSNPQDYDDLYKMIAQGPVFNRAAMALMKLPIEHKPVPETRYPSYTNPEDVKPWRDWIEEIKAGKRTFRFVGDPTEYDLDGPASKEKIERSAKIRERDIERQAERDAERQAERDVERQARKTRYRKKRGLADAVTTAPEESKDGWLTAMAVGGGFLAMGAWLLISSRKKIPMKVDE